MNRTSADHRRDVSVSLLTCFLVAALIAGWCPQARGAAHQLRVVYLVPADRQPLDDYAARLHHLMVMAQRYFSRQMAGAGFLDALGNGKTFRFETGADGQLVVHLIDHRPGGAHANPERNTEYYTKNPAAIDRETPECFGAGFGDNAIVVHITDFASINPDHTIKNGPNYGGGGVWEGDHIFGNDIENPGVVPEPLRFLTLACSDAEQVAIFRDHRFTNIWGGGPYWRPALTDYRRDEWADLQNSQVWEYSSIFLGAFIHEMGHAFGLHHCFNHTPSPLDTTVNGDFQLMGNGFRGIFASLYPTEGFSGLGQYPRHPIGERPKVCGSPVIIDPSQLVALNCNRFFNTNTGSGRMAEADPAADRAADDAIEVDRDPPVISELSVLQADGGERVAVAAPGLMVRCVARDRPGPNASGLSHVAFVLDGNNRGLAMAPRNAGPDAEINGVTLLMTRPGEDASLLLPRGLHWLCAEAMDRAGNQLGAVDPTANYAISVGEARISDWLVWDRFFDVSGADGRAMLDRSWLPMADGRLRPEPDQQLGRGRWRRVHPGAYLDLHGFDKRNFSSATGGRPRMAYVAARVQTPYPRSMLMNIGCDDFAQVWVNGIAVYTEDANLGGHGAFDTARYGQFPVTFTSGVNTVLVKVLDTGGGAGVHAWFTDTASNPVFLGAATSEAEVVFRD